MNDASPVARSSADLHRWRRYLADERAEAAVYRELAGRRRGEEREILMALAEAEGRHEAHWAQLLGADIGKPARADARTRFLALFARRFGSVFVLALAQRAEGRSPYADDPHATPAMAADERVHAEVVRGLAARGRKRLSGTFRAAVFGANDGLVSNLALVLGIAATGVANSFVLFSGVAGLLAGALSMGAGEYVSVRSQRELLAASAPDPETDSVLPDLDVDANELALVYRARGLSEDAATDRAVQVMAALTAKERMPATASLEVVDDYEAVGTAMGAAASSFGFFASGALIPILPFVFGLQGVAALVVSIILVGVALTLTGAVVGLLSGAPPLARALRQLAIGWGAALVTYLLGLLFGASVGG